MKNSLKKIVFISIQFLIVILVLSCSKDEVPNLSDVKYGKFWGEIGPDVYNLVNDKSNPRMHTTHFDGKNYQFKFAVYDSSNHLGNVFKTDTELTVNLTDVFNTQSYSAFETHVELKNYSKDWVHLYYHKIWNDIDNLKIYIPVKSKSDLDVKLLSIEYEQLKTPSLKGTIKGYLYNIKNPKDSILIDAHFTTQASY